MNEAKFRATKSSVERIFRSPTGNLQGVVTRQEIFRQFLDILVSRRGFRVSDPRDMIYAHLGLVEMPVLEVDYEKTTAQVFQLFVEKYLAATGDFRILAHIGENDLDNRQLGLATWAVNWSSSNAGTSPRQTNLANAVEWNPSITHGPFKGEVSSWQFENGVLQTRAEMVSTVHNLSDTLDTTSYGPYSAGRWDLDLDLGIGLLLGFPTRKSLTEADCAMSWLMRQVSQNQQLYATFVADLKEYRRPGTLMQYLLMEIQQSASSNQSVLDGARLASVEYHEKFELALVPASTKIGDLIRFLEHYNAPLVLRRLQQSHAGGSECKGSCVNVVGHCLINGPFFHYPTQRRIFSRVVKYDHGEEAFVKCPGHEELLSIH